MKCQVLLVLVSLTVFCPGAESATLEAKNVDRQARQVIAAGVLGPLGTPVGSTMTVDAFGTPVVTTAMDAMGGIQNMGGGGAGMAIDSSALPSCVDAYTVTAGLPNTATGGFGTTIVDTSGLGMGVGLTATMGEAVGNFYDLITAYNYIFSPVDTSNSFYILPPNLQAYIPDCRFIIESPPTYDNYILACDIYGTGMCYYYYYSTK